MWQCIYVCVMLFICLIGLLPLGVAVLATILDIVVAEAVIAVVAMLDDETTLNESKIQEWTQ